jgi:hypothetical protein
MGNPVGTMPDNMLRLISFRHHHLATSARGIPYLVTFPPFGRAVGLGISRIFLLITMNSHGIPVSR